MIKLISNKKLYFARVTIDGITGTVGDAIPNKSVSVFARGVQHDFEWNYFQKHAIDILKDGRTCK